MDKGSIMSKALREALWELVALKEIKDECMRRRQRRPCSITRVFPQDLLDAEADYKFRKPLAWEAARAALASQSEQVAPPVWRDLAAAPRDGTILRLLVRFSDNSMEDSQEPQVTVGGNSADNTGEDLWQFAGWNWENDYFTEGIGEVLGWLPLMDGAAQPAPAAQSEPLTDEQIDEAAHELQRVIGECGGESTECAYDYLRGILAKLPLARSRS